MAVLVVEDEALVRAIVIGVLSDEGLAVAEAPSAEHALARTEMAGTPDVVVTDIELRQCMNGSTLTERFRRRWPDTGVVIMTGSPEGAQADSLGEKEGFRSKPFGNTWLVSAVRELVGSSTR